ncbi:MAG: hypothetical protein GKR94_25750 [Gammaproteobacteria bacterium]|nr:hypothetical protein [Gammaproteobacteria bacterium]
MGCPDAIAALGEVYHQGKLIPKDNNKSKELLEKSIEQGSAIGKKYYLVKFNDLAGKMAESFNAFGEQLEKAIKEIKPQPIRSGKKIGPNEKCPCGSGLKYKKCCRDKPNKKIQVTPAAHLI